jgi:hypothetical protein
MSKSRDKKGFLGNAVRAHGPQHDGPGTDASARPAGPAKETAKGRNIKIPDNLYDAVCYYALKTKITIKTDRTVNGIHAGTKETTRSMYAAEVVCKALNAYQPLKQYISIANPQPTEGDEPTAGDDVEQDPPADEKRVA